jgi:CTP synthase
MKYVVVTGGVVSGLGKGITISSIGRVLKSSGLRVTSIKIDPYLNVDAGTMSPFEHGETFVLDDGGETDLDLGNYERFLDITLSARHNITTGKVYKEVIHQERRGDYLGKTVQIVPHLTDLVQGWIEDVAKVPVDGSGLEPDVCLVEVGGTVGDIESMVFLEALRQFQFSVGRENMVLVHVSLVPVLGSVGEQKTKPTQHTVKELRSIGLFPDVIVCRSSEMLSLSTRQKLSIMCQVQSGNVLSVHDVSNIYHVPLILVEQGIHKIIRNQLGLTNMAEEPNLASWRLMAESVDDATQKVDIVIVGKYTGLSDSYLSVIKSLTHAGIHLNVDVNIVWIEASDLEEGTRSTNPEKYDEAWETLKNAAGMVVPGGFGVRGVEGKVAAAKYARESKKPYLGICLGFQVMVIEYARNVLGLKNAHSTEFDEATTNPVVMFMPEVSREAMGGTMRLGSRATVLSPSLPESAVGAANKGKVNSLASALYGFSGLQNATPGQIYERHRHRYEVNPEVVDKIEAAGLIFTGRDDTGVRMEIAELPTAQHPYYIGAQFHPEFKSRPNRPSPVFFGLVAVASGKSEQLHSAGDLWQKDIVTKKAMAEQLAAPPSSASPSRVLKKRSASFLASAQSTPAATAPKTGTALTGVASGTTFSPMANAHSKKLQRTKSVEERENTGSGLANANANANANAIADMVDAELKKKVINK